MTQAIIEELDLGPGDHYEGFEILRVLGKGSYARVFSARHANYAQPIALKISRVPLSSEVTAIRALREIRALQSLSNPNVVHILDHGMGADERWYMVMELLDGATLLEVHDFDHPMGPQRALSLIYQACVGLEEAHRQGIVHRDLKPENLWILAKRRYGRELLKILDFGLARAWDPSVTVGEQATVGHMLIGTPHYAQPEQVESGVLTPASDVYSLGMMLYELLTGHVPYYPDESWAAVVLRLSKKPIRWLGAHVKKQLVPIDHHERGRALSEACRELVHAMLAKDPEQRPAHAGVAARMIADILQREYDLPVAASLELDGGVELIVPGSHTIGEQTGTIALRGIGGATAWSEARLVAKLDWAGAGALAVLAPIEAELCRVDGEALREPTELRPGAIIELGALRMCFQYPRA